ncbi:hypothetical protein BY458DRAFT_16320 [Sporodiniella umbellata]|nr:hypothetical protein BY458DRAFT_16320 [Sporodiniella umbellata]
MLANNLNIQPINESDDFDTPEEKPNRRNGRRKIKIEYIEDKNRRHITFSKRKSGIMKKAYELSTLTGTQVLLLVVSETGLVYTFTTTKLQPMVTKPEGKNLIQSCLNTADPEAETEEQEEPEKVESKENSPIASPARPSPQSRAPQPMVRPIPHSSPVPPIQQPNQSPYPPMPSGYNPRYTGYSGNMPNPNYPSYGPSFYPSNYWSNAKQEPSDQNLKK